MKVARKFYVGHPRMVNDINGPNNVCTWSKATLAEAVALAEANCRKTGGDQIVVQVVRVVRKQQTPISVEVVK